MILLRINAFKILSYIGSMISDKSINHQGAKRNLLGTNVQYLTVTSNGQTHTIKCTKVSAESKEAKPAEVTEYKKLQGRVLTFGGTSVTLYGWSKLIKKNNKIIALRELTSEGGGHYLEYFKLEKSIDV